MSEGTITALAAIHGLYNFTVFVIFLIHGFRGVQIRRGRKAGKPAVRALQIHRGLGPVWAVMGIVGFGAGALIAVLDQGSVLLFPPHFVIGALISTVIIITFAVSRGINSPSTPLRSVHLGLGVLLIVLYTFQTLIGVTILRSLLS
ncbi:MAG: DUF4079 family protein [Terriglobia bacterium]